MTISAREIIKTSCQKTKRALRKRGEAAQTAADRNTQQGENVLLLPKYTSSHLAENLSMSCSEVYAAIKKGFT